MQLHPEDQAVPLSLARIDLMFEQPDAEGVPMQFLQVRGTTARHRAEESMCEIRVVWKHPGGTVVRF
jgi:hypothetical protein